MPKVIDPYEQQHLDHLAKYGKQIDAIFKTATEEAARIGEIIKYTGLDNSHLLSFSDYPLTHKRLQQLLSNLHKNVETAIVNGIEAEWTLANNKNSALSRRVFGDNVGRLTQAQYRRYFSTNEDARQAFLARKEQGLNLSERVWRYTECFKNDIELGLDVGIRNGLDANAMSRQLRDFLRYPDKLFRRVRDEHGNLVLSQRAADFHPGQGVYRSSYKNARRLAVTETNMAYRTADYERMQQLNFVVGIEIRLSNNHTCNGLPLTDICDELKGRYPKDFKFVGWHPHCRCHVIQILKTEDELAEENRAILAGKAPSTDSVNRVSDVPQEFKNWIEQNEYRIKTAHSIPYFMQDNGTITNGKFTLKEFAKPMHILTVAELAAIRHANRTPEQIADIKERWAKKQKRDATTRLMANNVLKVAQDWQEVDFSTLQKIISDNNLGAMRAEAKKVAQAIKAMRDEEKALSTIIPDVHEWHKKFSLAELKQAHKSVTDKLAKLESKGMSLDTDSNLSGLKKKLEFEMDYVENPGKYKPGAKPHNTWEIAQEAYQQQLAKVEARIEILKLNDEYEELLKFKTTSKYFKDYMAKTKASLDDGDAKNAKYYLNIAKSKKAGLEKNRKGKSVKTTSAQFDNEAYTQNRKDAAMWAQDTKEADKRLRGKCGEVWRAATEAEKDAIYGYTESYCNINEPLRGLTYCGSAAKKKEGLQRIPHIESVIDKSSYDFDMWLQRGDNFIALKKFGLQNWIKPTDADIMALLGAEGVEGAFWSAGVAKGKGFGGSIIFNIYAPKGTKAMYCEPFSAYGKGKGRDWDGIKAQKAFGDESEILIQRGTKFKITKIEKSGNQWYIDVDIIEQQPVAFPYVGGYPFK